MFSLCSAIYFNAGKNTDESRSVGHIYLLEAVGAGISGLAALFILLKYFSSFTILLTAIILNLIAVIYYLLDHEKIHSKILFPSSSIHLTIRMLLYSCLLFILSKDIFIRLDRNSEQVKWGNYSVLENVNSIYGNISVIKLNESFHFYSNGLLMFSYPDFYNSEESVHFAMLQHTEAKDVLKIGGGLNGSLLEILKYKNIENIDYVELDPTLIKTAKKYLPAGLFEHRKINYHYGDGRHFIKNSKKKYDVIIIDLPNPYTIQLNRFYTIEFFKDAEKILKPDGVFSCRISSSENYISEILKDYLRSIYTPLKYIFEKTAVIPGESAIFLAGKSESVLNIDPESLSNLVIGSKLNNSLVNQHYIPVRLDSERVKYLLENLETDEPVIQNTDLNPIAYYFDMVLWSTHFSQKLRSFFLYLNNINLKFLFILTIIFMYGVFSFFYFVKQKTPKKNLYLAVLITGFSGITFELIILLLFQILYGYLYYQIAVILTAYMAGAGLGSYYILRKNFRLKNLIFIQLAFAVFPVFILVSYIIFSLFTGPAATFIGKYLVFTFLACTAGALTGAHFILSNNIYKVKKESRDWGKIYAVDLLGAAAGALLLSSILIPIFGLKFILTILCGLNLFAAIILGLAYRN
ncbi:hypothetical protein ACFL4T_11950 [candidate division KSB1 bacterium]